MMPTNNADTTAQVAVLVEKLDALNILLAEKDLRYAQRFQAQEMALMNAMTAIDKGNSATITALAAAMAASEKAILKAEAANEKRFESVNEFRGTLTDQQAEFARKSEVNIRFTGMEEKITALVAAQLQTLGKGAGLNAAWAYALGAAALVAALASAATIIFK